MWQMIFRYKNKSFPLVLRGRDVVTSDLCGISDLANKGAINPNDANIVKE